MHPNDGRVVSNFVVQALKGEPITVYGDGSQTRSFCYVDDLVEALVRLMNTDDDITGPINIGNSEEYTILELANKVIELTGSRSKVDFSFAAKRRPEAETAGYRTCKSEAWMDARHSARRRTSKTIEYFVRAFGRNGS